MNEDFLNEIDSMFDNLLELTKSDIKLDCDYPYLIFSRDELVKVLNISRSIILTKSENLAYNSISFVPNKENKVVYMYVTNELTHIRLYTELLGVPDKFLDKDISIQYTTLKKLVKMMGKKVLLYLKDNKLYIRLLSGDLLIEHSYPNNSIITFPTEKNEFISSVDLNTLGTVLNNMLPLLNSDIQGNLCKISFLGDKAYYRSAFYYLESNITTPMMSLSIRDSEMIADIHKLYPDYNLMFYNTKSSIPRMFCHIDNIDFLFISRVDSISSTITAQMEKVFKEPEFYIEIDNFYKTINLSTTLTTYTGDITLSYNIEDKDKNLLYLDLVSSRGQSRFNFDMIDSKITKSNSINLKAITLKKLLQSFDLDSKIGLGFSDACITIVNDNIKALLIHI